MKEFTVKQIRDEISLLWTTEKPFRIVKKEQKPNGKIVDSVIVDKDAP